MQPSLAAAPAESFSMFVYFSLKRHESGHLSSSSEPGKKQQTDKKKFDTERVTLVPETNHPLITYEMSCDKRHCLSKVTKAGADSRNNERGISCITNMATPSGS